MDCSKAEELFVPFLLGALESPEREELSDHIETCPNCSNELQLDGETVAQFAYAVPQLEVPSGIKENLLARVDADLRPSLIKTATKRFQQVWSITERTLFAQTARAVASVLLLGIIFGGVWFNAKISHMSKENQELAERIKAVAEENQGLNGQLEEMTARESQVIDMVKDQRLLTYEVIRLSAAPGTSVNTLSGTGWTAEARGVMVVSRTGREALLLAINLPPLPADKVYQVWLIKDGQRHNSGLFHVDSTGYGQTVIIPYGSITEFEAIQITVEPSGGSIDPTGTSVMNGDL